MQIKRINYRLAGVAIVLQLLLHSQASLAAAEQATARVQIVPALAIGQQSEIDFGQLNNVNGTCTMGNGGTLSGTEGQNCTGTQSPAVFRISGQDGASINITASSGQLPGITFYPSVQGSSQRTLTDGSVDITVLGSLVLENTSDGDKIISYVLSANYE